MRIPALCWLTASAVVAVSGMGLATIPLLQIRADLAQMDRDVAAIEAAFDQMDAGLDEIAMDQASILDDLRSMPLPGDPPGVQHR